MAEATKKVEPRLLRLSDLAAEWEADAKAAWDSYVAKTPRGATTGLEKLDGALGGWLQAGLHVFHGGPGVGKTALGLQIGAQCGYPALFVSCEMRALELVRRIVARVTETFLGRLKSGEFPPPVSMELLQRSCEAVPLVAIADSTQVFATPSWICTQAKQLKDSHDQVLVVIDSVHAWAEGAAGDLTEYEALNAALSSLRSLSARLECPVLLVAERNRLSMSKGGLSAGAGTRKIEYGAESVWDLAVEKDAQPNAAGEVFVTLKLEKNRNGAAGQKIPLQFNGALQRFKEV